MIAAIASVDLNMGIGYKNNLLTHIPEDMRFFKERTEGSIVIMGRRTWESLPKKPLSNRINIVITHTPECDATGVLYSTLDNIKVLLKQKISSNIFIIGGSTIYKELLPFCDTIYLTKIYKEYLADTYFPSIDNSWKISKESGKYEYQTIQYQFLTLRKNELIFL